jgi:hypothetical protein
MLCKIWRFHGCDYEECRLVGYETLLRTSQETHYVSATEPNRLMLCKIWGFQDGDYEECRLLRYGAVWFIRTNVSKERVPSIFWVDRISERGTTLAETNSDVSSSSLVTADVLTSLILSILKMEATHSSETFALTKPIRRHILEDNILQKWCSRVIKHCRMKTYRGTEV